MSRNGEDRRPCLVSIKYFSIKYNVSWRLFIDKLYQVEKIPFIPCLLRVFIRNRHWSFSNAFITSTEVIICVFFFSLLICSYIIWFQMLSQSIILGINLIWLWCIFKMFFHFSSQKGRNWNSWEEKKKKLGKYNISFLIHYSVLVSNLSIREDYNLCLLLITSQYNF